MILGLLSLRYGLQPTLTIAQLDYTSDNSITRYVGHDVGFSVVGYRPIDLVAVMPRTSLLYSERFEATGYHMLRTEARTSLYRLADAHYADTQQPLTLVSAYRSYQFQQSISSDECITKRLCAIPGRSEHQAGLAIDLGSPISYRLTAHSAQYRRLQQHAHLYGWHQTYQYGPAVDGYQREIWHRRYIGVPLATRLHQHRMSFGQGYRHIEGVSETLCPRFGYFCLK